jgi:acyl-CoA dehydrogenase
VEPVPAGGQRGEASGYHGAGLTNQEYAPLAEIMGRVMWASEVFNCSAPDTGNMETIARYGSEENKARWLKPLLEGKIRSAFAMTEPDVASSDATNIATRIERQGDEYVINGRKWWTRAPPTRAAPVYITMGKTDPDAPRHSQQSMVSCPPTPPASSRAPAQRDGLRRRAARPHGGAVRERARARLQHPAGRRPWLRDRPGPPRPRAHPPLHAPDRPGRARAGIDVQARASARVAFGKTVAQQTVTQERIAEARCKIDMARLLTLKAAWMMDVAGNKVAKTEIAMIKVVAPSMACQVIDWAMQAHGGGGMCDDFPLA